MRDQPFRRSVLFCVILGLPTVAGSGTGQSPTSGFDVTDRVVASTIYSLVQQYFAHWEGAPRSEVEAAYREYIAYVVRAHSLTPLTLNQRTSSWSGAPRPAIAKRSSI
jgi:hypothetical protein